MYSFYSSKQFTLDKCILNNSYVVGFLLCVEDTPLGKTMSLHLQSVHLVGLTGTFFLIQWVNMSELHTDLISKAAFILLAESPCRPYYPNDNQKLCIKPDII